MNIDINPIPVNHEVLNNIINKIHIDINLQPIRESIVAMIITINDLIAQQDEITFNQVIHLITSLHNRSKN